MQSLKILLVEDERLQRKYLAQCLEEKGIRVTDVNNLENARQYIQEVPPPDLVILDLVLEQGYKPRQNGSDLINILESKNIPYICTTAYEHGEELRKVRNAKHQPLKILLKPYQIQELLMCIKNTLN